MDLSELCYTPALELRRLIARREVSAYEVTRLVLERIAAVNPRLNAIVAARPEAALQEAEAADAAVSRGEELGPLHGVPFTVKDTFATLDMPTTGGSRVYSETPSTEESISITRLRQAGAILLGKTNMPEYGLLTHTDSPLFGPTNNPWRVAHSVGGSSGGAGAAAAAGLAPLALGGDGGGSIRTPASWCGVVGLKPARARVPALPATWEPLFGIITAGPLTRTVRDAALMLDVIAGPVLGEPYPLPPAAEPFLAACDREPGRLRLAFSTDFPHGPVDPEVQAAVREAARLFESLGHHVEEAAPDREDWHETWLDVAAPGLARGITETVPPHRMADLTANTLVLMHRGLAMTAVEFDRAFATIRAAGARLLQFWHRYDCWLTPTSPTFPPKTSEYTRMIGDQTGYEAGFTYPMNISGQPAISVPCGWSAADGVPVGLQIVGPPAGEALILSLAAQYEAARPWAHLRPSL